MKKILLLAISLLMAGSTGAREIRITPENTGSLKKVRPGDVVQIAKGNYSRPLRLAHIQGTAERPVRIISEPGVVLDGTDRLDGRWKEVTPESVEGRLIQPAQWKRMKGKLYCQQVNHPVYALIYNGRLMNNARWPDSGWDDPWRQDRYYVLRRAEVGSVQGKLQDGLPTGNALEESSAWLHYDRSQCRQREELLGETGLSFTGAVMVMSHTWGSWATRVTWHEAGSDFIEYDTTFSGSGSIRNEADTFLNHRIGWDKGSKKFARSSHGGIHFFLMGLPALDNPTEWWYDQKSGLVFFISPDGRMPGKGEVQGKRRDYALLMDQCSHVRFEGAQFYGAAMKLTDCTDCCISDCEFKFSASEKFCTGNFDMPATACILNPKAKKPAKDSLINCRFSYLDGNAFEAKSRGMVVDNVLVYRTQQTTLGLASHTMLLERPSVVRRMTIDDVGASVGIRGGGAASVYELNNIMHFGGLQYDGAAIQTGGRDTVIYRYNWSHDHPKRSFRFDAGGYPQFANAFGEMSYNVAWNTPAGYSVKGDDHFVHNNLCIEGGFLLFNMKRWASKNERTVVANNIVSYLSGGDYDWNVNGYRKNNRSGVYEKVDDFWMKETVVPEGTPSFIGKHPDEFDDGNNSGSKGNSPILSILHNNCYGSPEQELRDPENLDFRLKADSPLRQGGYLLTRADVPWKSCPITGSETWKGNPSIGPYEPDEDHYWIPGFQFEHASTPIPVNGTRTAKADCDLMWLEGWKASGHIVYFGTSEKEVAEAHPDSACKIAEFSGNENILHLDEYGKILEPGKEYYWRVDALQEDGPVKGEVWHFRVR